jgi:hypothetical protein
MRVRDPVDVFEKLQAWYVLQCNGAWEHEYGISIDTMDNPGWSVSIDLTDTSLEKKVFKEVRYTSDSQTDWYASDLDWYRCEVKDGKFLGFCGPKHLAALISTFVNWALADDEGDQPQT